MEKRLKKLYFKTLGITLAVLLVILALLYGGFLYLVGGFNRQEINENNLSVNEELGQYGNQKIMNIGFFGLDSREHDYEGRADAMMIASANRETGKIKLISIARDTYVSIPGYEKTRINHSYAYGGAELAIQTINQNFGLDITDYITVNFDSLAEIIDELGGIEIEVTEAERVQINEYLLRGEPLKETGLVHLNGPQAVSYSRIRKIDSDDMRTQRQRNVLTALFEKAKNINPLLYPSYIRKFAPLVETSLSNDEMIKLASAGIKGSMQLEQEAFPNDYIFTEGKYIGPAWYYVYDLNQAADMLEQLIYHDIPFAQYGKEAEMENSGE